MRMDLQIFGGRGASSGISDRGKPYGSEYTTLHEQGNIKFVRYNDSLSAKTPQETMTKQRVYVTVNQNDELKSITMYDKSNKRYKQIDIAGREHIIDGKKTIPHTHYGYNHDEHGTKAISSKERALIDRVKRIWYSKKSKC